MKAQSLLMYNIGEGIEQAIGGIRIGVSGGFPAKARDVTVDRFFVVAQKCQRVYIVGETIGTCEMLFLKKIGFYLAADDLIQRVIERLLHHYYDGWIVLNDGRRYGRLAGGPSVGDEGNILFQGDPQGAVFYDSHTGRADTARPLQGLGRVNVLTGTMAEDFG